MSSFRFPWLFQRILPFRLVVVATAGWFAASVFSTPVRAQNAAPPGPMAAAQPGQPVLAGADNGTGSRPAGSLDDAWLKKTGSLYYSTTQSGLGGFDCAVHPDWRALFSSANAGAPVDLNDARILLLESVKINLHAHLEGGGSTLDWTPEPSAEEPLDPDALTLLTKMREVTEETIEGFLQFWTPFVDGSVVPASADGLTITHTGSGHTIHAQDSATALTETFSNDMLLEHFDVDQNGTSIKFQPAYKPTEQGLLVKSFQAHVQPAGVPAEQAEELHVDIEYQTLEGFPIPARLAMETSSGTFNFTLDGCSVSRLQRTERANAVKPAL